MSVNATPLRITICPVGYRGNCGELTRFGVDAATVALREVAGRVSADPLLRCRTARYSAVCRSKSLIQSGSDCVGAH